MQYTIYKYPLKIEDYQDIEMPRGAQINEIHEENK